MLTYFSTGSEFYYFSHAARPRRIIRTIGGIHIPTIVGESVDIISGVNDFPSVRRSRSRTGTHLGELEETLRNGARASSGWYFKPSGGDSVLALTIYVPVGDEQPTGVGTILKTDGGYSSEEMDFPISKAKIRHETDYTVYDIFVYGLANGHATVSVQLQYKDGLKSEWNTYGSQVPSGVCNYLTRSEHLER